MKNKTVLLFILLFPASPVFTIALNLQEAEQLAINSSSDIRNAGEQLGIAILKNNLDIREFLPSISINFSSSGQLNIASPDSGSVKLGIDLKQAVFNGGRSVQNRKLSEIRLHLQSASLELLEEEQRDQLWQLFYSILLNKEKHRLQDELMNLSTDQLRIAEKKLEIGKITELDYLGAVIEVQKLELDILETENSEHSLISDFAVITGFAPELLENGSINLVGNLNREYRGMSLYIEDFHCYTEMAFLMNHSLKQKSVEIKQILTENQILKSGFLPRVSIESSFYVLGERFPLQEPGISLSLTVDFPFQGLPSSLNTGGSLQSNNQLSASIAHKSEIFPDAEYIVNQQSVELKLRQSAAALEEQKLSIERNIKANLEQLEHKRLSITVRRKTQQLQQRQLQILETRCSMGELRELDLLQARIEFFKEEIGIREAVLNLMRVERELEKLIGAEFGSLAVIADSVHNRNSK